MTSKQTCDFLIIGGGSAGAIIARRLADSNIGSVILVEAGKSDEHDKNILDLSRLDQQTESTEWDFLASTVHSQPASLKYSRAKMLGGCGGHNDCAFLIPPLSDFDQWQSSNENNWSKKCISQYFKKVDGMVNVDIAPPVSPVSQMFIQAGKELGLKELNYRETINEGVGVFPLNARGDARQSASVAYLHPLEQQSENLKVLCNTMATKIVFENNKAIGCTFENKDHHYQEIYANAEVILCCGAIQTPHLLMVSGIGPKSNLSAAGIQCKLDSPYLGKNLSDHACANLILELKNPIPQWQLTPCEVMMMRNIDQATPEPELLYHFVLGARDKYNDRISDYPNNRTVKISPNVTRPKSRGNISIASPDIHDHPVIQLNYFSDSGNLDMNHLIKGLRYARDISESETFYREVKAELLPGINIQSDSQLEKYILDTCETVYHPAGTCKMGDTQDHQAVVNTELLLNGIENLRVCDASIFPSMVSVNINNTVMMVAERASDLIIQKWQ